MTAPSRRLQQANPASPAPSLVQRYGQSASGKVPPLAQRFVVQSARSATAAASPLRGSWCKSPSPAACGSQAARVAGGWKEQRPRRGLRCGRLRRLLCGGA